MRTGPVLCRIFLSLTICCIPLYSHAQLLSAASTYLNEDVGVRVSLNAQWQLSTSYEQAPATMKPNFPPNKGPNDSPLFIAIHENQQLFSRLLIEPFFGNLDNYAVLLSQSIATQGIAVHSAKMSEDNSALELEYVHTQLGLRFKERAALLEDGRVIRMAVWASKFVFDEFSEQIDEAFAEAQLSGVVHAQVGWQPIWRELNERLLSDNVVGINIVEEEESVETVLACADPSSSMLWKVTGKGGEDLEVYLFGSLHVGEANFYPLHSIIEDAFYAADHLVFEVDPNAAADPTIVQDMQARGMLPAGERLADVVSPEVLATLRRVMRDIGIPAESFMTMQPWFLTLVLSNLQMTSLGYSAQFGIESYLLSQKSANSDILELETIEDQIALLEELNTETYLNYTLQGFAEGAETLEALVQAWRCADKETLNSILFDDFSSSDEISLMEEEALEKLEEMLFYDRNITMAEGIRGYLENGSGEYFVVVGSGHLLGERSVIELLRNDGYQVSPVLLSQ